MAHNNTLIFAPTYNEQGTIGTLIDALLALPVRSDLLFVDDSSTDGTTEYLRSVAAAEPRVHVIVRPGKLGVGSAHKLGWLYARMHGYSRIVTLDADLSHDPQDVVRLLAALDAGRRRRCGGFPVLPRRTNRLPGLAAFFEPDGELPCPPGFAAPRSRAYDFSSCCPAGPRYAGFGRVGERQWL